MPTTILIFITIAVVAATVFAVSLLELFLTSRRLRIEAGLRRQISDLKSEYNLSLNRIILEDDAKLSEVETQIAALSEQDQNKPNPEVAAAESSAQAELEQSRKELERAKQRAKKSDEIARQKADDYFKTRQAEVENVLMDLVIDVTKKVLPDGLTYEVHKELVLQALQQVRSEGNE